MSTQSRGHSGNGKQIPGLGLCEFQSGPLSPELLGSYFGNPMRRNYRRFMSEVGAALIVKPTLTAREVDELPEFARARLRVGIAQSLGFHSAYRRLSGFIASGDERLFAAVLYSTSNAEGSTEEGAQDRGVGQSSPAPLEIPIHVRRLMRSPALDAMVRMQRTQRDLNRLAGSTPFKALDAARRNQREAERLSQIGRSDLDAIKKNRETMERLMRSPALEAIERIQKNLGRSPLLETLRINQGKRMRSPALEAMERIQKNLFEIGRSPAVEAFLAQSKKLGGRLNTAFTRSFEAFARYVEEHWADLQGHPPEHPPPAMFVLASLPMSLGLPLYKAVVAKEEEKLLDLLEPVVTDSRFVDDVQAAIHQAPLLSPVARRHLITAFNWLKEGQYVDAYPPFYNGIETAFKSAARSSGVIDEENHFLVSARTAKANKVEDLFEHLPLGHRFRRFLRSWIFDQVGNPFRHGDVSDPADCRRQSLLLAVAVVGWLERFGEWDNPTFWGLLESEASKRTA